MRRHSRAHTAFGSVALGSRFAVCVLVAVAAFASSAAHAAPPVNDACASATVVNALPYAEDVPIGEATSAPSDPVHSCSGSADHHSVWYRYTPSVTGTVTAHTDWQSLAVAAVYTGSCGALTEIVCDDAVELVAGTTYLIQFTATQPFASVIHGNIFIVDGTVCGDGTVQPPEECDDGDQSDANACTNACVFNVCGDGLPGGPLEECDDGNVINEDVCTNSCRYNICGDGYGSLISETSCDDGNLVDGDGCDSTCTVTGPNHCAAPMVLTPPYDAHVLPRIASTHPSDPVHSCTGSQDFHTLWYSYTPAITSKVVFRVNGWAGSALPVVALYAGVCGALGTELQCVPHALAEATVTWNAEVGATYLIEVSTLFPTGISDTLWILFDHFHGCGDGVTDGDEWCDDGNEIDDDACHNDCNINGVCGNGITEGGLEVCDDGNTQDGDGCTSTCRLPCPADLCACLGSAARFDMMGSTVDLGAQSVSEEGESYFLESATGSICAVTGKFDGDLDAATDVGGDVVVTESIKYAATFKTFNIEGAAQTGTFIAGDLVTGGGAAKDIQRVEIQGVYDRTGTHPEVALCQQARTDVPAGSAVLASLTPTSTLPSIEIDDGEVHPINAGAGVHVINVPSITLKPARNEDGEPVPSNLQIVLAPDTETVIINVAGNVTLGEECAITVDGDVASVVLNLHGKKPKLKLKELAFIEPAIVAPRLKPLSAEGVELSNLLTLTKLKLRGSGVFDVLGCPAQ